YGTSRPDRADNYVDHRIEERLALGFPLHGTDELGNKGRDWNRHRAFRRIYTAERGDSWARRLMDPPRPALRLHSGRAGEVSSSLSGFCGGNHVSERYVSRDPRQDGGVYRQWRST